MFLLVRWGGGNTGPSLLGISLGEFLSRLLEFLRFFGKLLRDGLLEGVIRLGRLHHAVHHGQAVLGVQRRRPGSDHVRADLSRIGLDGGMVDFRRELQVGSLERVLGGKLELEHELPPRVGRIRGSHDHAVPVEDVFPDHRNRVDEGKRLLFEDRPFLQ